MPLKFLVKFHFGFCFFFEKNDGKGKLRKREKEKPNRILTSVAVVFGVTRAPHAHTLSASRERDRRGDMLSVLSLRSVRIWRVGAMLSSLFGAFDKSGCYFTNHDKSGAQLPKVGTN